MSDVLQTNRAYTLPGTYIGEDIQPGGVSISPETRVATFVGRGSNYIQVKNSGLTRGYVSNAALKFSLSSPFTSVLKTIASGLTDSAVLVDGTGIEVRKDQWMFTSDNTGVIVADAAYNPASTYFLSYQGADAGLGDDIPTADIRVISAIGSQLDQDQYKRNEDYFIDTVTLPPVAAVGADGSVIKLTNSTFEFTSIAHTGTGAGVVALDPYAAFEHAYTRSYGIRVVSITGSKTTFAWTATPISAGNASLPAVPLTAALAAPTFVVDSADVQTQTVSLELGVKLVLTGTFVVGDVYAFTAYGPALLEVDSSILNKNQFPEVSAVVPAADNVGAGILSVDGTGFTGTTNLNFQAEVLAVDSGSVSATLPTAQIAFSAAPGDGTGFTISNGRTGVNAGVKTFEFDSNGVQAVPGSTLVTIPGVAAQQAQGVISFTGSSSESIADGSYVVVSDGVRTVTFEFDNDNVLSIPSATRVVIASGIGASANTAANLATAITNSVLRVTVVDNSAANANVGKLHLTVNAAGVAGNTQITVGQNGSNPGTFLQVQGFTGGSDTSADVAGTIANTITAINAADLGIYAQLNTANASIVNLVHGARLVLATNPTAGDSFTVNVGGTATVYEFIAVAGTPANGHVGIEIGAAVGDTITNVLAIVNAGTTVLAYGYAARVLFVPVAARNLTITSALPVIPSVVDDSTAMTNGNVLLVASGALTGVALSGFSGGTDASTSPDQIHVAWASSGDEFGSGTVTLTDAASELLFRGVKLGLGGGAARPATGTISLSANPADGNTVTVGDGILVAPIVFEFDSNSTVAIGHVKVTIGATVAATIANLYSAILASTLQVTPVVHGTSVVLTAKKTGPGPSNAYNTAITSVGASIHTVGFAGGALNYAVGDRFSFTVKAARRFTMALDNRTTNLTVAQVGISGDASALNFIYDSNTPEGGFGTLSTDSSEGGYLTLPGQIRIVARNIVGNRFTAGDKFSVEQVNNWKIYWSLNTKTTDAFSVNDVAVDRNGTVTGTYGAFYVSLANTPLAGSLKLTLGSKAFTDYRQIAGTAILVLALGDSTDLLPGLTVAYTYSGNEPALGTSYFISGQYKRPDSMYNVAKVFYDQASALEYLAPVTAENDLAIAVQIAFAQAQPPLAVGFVQVKDADEDGVFSPADIDAALAGAKDVYWISDLVPLRLYQFWSKFMAFNVAACDPFEKREHMLYFGAPVGTQIGDAGTQNSLVYLAKTTLQVFGKSYAHGTRILVAPRMAKKAVTLSDGSVSTVILDGSFVAAATAACVAGMPTYSQSLLKTKLMGLDYIETFGVSNNITLGGAGLIFFSDSGSGTYVFEEDQTVDTYSAEFHEILPMRTKQDVTRIVRDQMNSNVIGMVPNTRGDATATVAARLMQVLIGLVNRGITAPYQDEQGNTRSINSGDIEVYGDAADPTLYNFFYTFYTRFMIKRLYGLYQVNKNLSA